MSYFSSRPPKSMTLTDALCLLFENCAAPPSLSHGSGSIASMSAPGSSKQLAAILSLTDPKLELSAAHFLFTLPNYATCYELLASLSDIMKRISSVWIRQPSKTEKTFCNMLQFINMWLDFPHSELFLLSETDQSQSAPSDTSCSSTASPANLVLTNSQRHLEALVRLLNEWLKSAHQSDAVTFASCNSTLQRSHFLSNSNSLCVAISDLLKKVEALSNQFVNRSGFVTNSGFREVAVESSATRSMSPFSCSSSCLPSQHVCSSSLAAAADYAPSLPGKPEQGTDTITLSNFSADDIAAQLHLADQMEFAALPVHECVLHVKLQGRQAAGSARFAAPHVHSSITLFNLLVRTVISTVLRPHLNLPSNYLHKNSNSLTTRQFQTSYDYEYSSNNINTDEQFVLRLHNCYETQDLRSKSESAATTRTGGGAAAGSRRGGKDSVDGAVLLPHCAIANSILIWIRVAVKLREVKNFSSLRAVLLGLESASVHRLTHCWRYLEKHHSRSFEQFQMFVKFFSAANNHEKLRRALIEDPPNNSTSVVLPYLGLYLADLTFIEEGLDTLIRIEQHHENGDDARSKSSSRSGMNNSKLNLDKCRKQFRLLHQLEQFRKRVVSAASITAAASAPVCRDGAGCHFLTWYRALPHFSEEENWQWSEELMSMCAQSHYRTGPRIGYDDEEENLDVHANNTANSLVNTQQERTECTLNVPNKNTQQQQNVAVVENETDALKASHGNEAEQKIEKSEKSVAGGATGGAAESSSASGYGGSSDYSSHSSNSTSTSASSSSHSSSSTSSSSDSGSAEPLQLHIRFHLHSSVALALTKHHKVSLLLPVTPVDTSDNTTSIKPKLNAVYRSCSFSQVPHAASDTVASPALANTLQDAATPPQHYLLTGTRRKAAATAHKLAQQNHVEEHHRQQTHQLLFESINYKTVSIGHNHATPREVIRKVLHKFNLLSGDGADGGDDELANANNIDKSGKGLQQHEEKKEMDGTTTVKDTKNFAPSITGEATDVNGLVIVQYLQNGTRLEITDNSNVFYAVKREAELVCQIRHVLYKRDEAGAPTGAVGGGGDRARVSRRSSTGSGTASSGSVMKGGSANKTNAGREAGGGGGGGSCHSKVSKRLVLLAGRASRTGSSSKSPLRT